MQAEQNKDPTERQMTKIAREAAKFTVQMMKADGIGTAEFDFIHLVRHNPGMTQADVRAALKIDKGAAARRAAASFSPALTPPCGQPGSQGLPGAQTEPGRWPQPAAVCHAQGRGTEKLQSCD